MCWNAILEVLSQKYANWNGVLEFFLRKTALDTMSVHHTLPKARAPFPLQTFSNVGKI
jgi:hypothetical protein